MALTALKGLAAAIPDYFGFSGIQSNLRMDASGEKVVLVFQIPRTGTLDRLSFRCSFVIAEDLRIGLETLDASGDPTGTQYGGSAPGVLVDPVTNNTFEVTLATPAAAVAGNWVAVVIQFDSTIGDVSVGVAATMSATAAGSPYVIHYSPAGAHKADALPLLSVRYSDGVYEPTGCLPAGSIAAQNVSTATVPDELGNIYQLPVPLGVRGVWALADADTALDLILYASDNSVLASARVGAPYRGGTSGGIIRAPFGTEILLTAGQAYRLVAKPATSSACVVYRLACLTQAHLDAWLAGEYCHETSRSDGGSWTETANQRIMLGLLGSSFDNGVQPSRRRGIWE